MIRSIRRERCLRPLPLPLLPWLLICLALASPAFSELPDCVRVAPDGSIPFEGIARNPITDVPIADSTVRLVFSSACTDLRMCPDEDVPPVFVMNTVTGPDGSFSFQPAVGGCCSTAGALELHADPGDVTIFIYDEIGSPDNGGDGTTDADLVVSLPDFARFSAAFLTADACFDYTVSQPEAADYCDGEVKLADFAAFASAFLNTCP